MAQLRKRRNNKESQVFGFPATIAILLGSKLVMRVTARPAGRGARKMIGPKPCLVRDSTATPALVPIALVLSILRPLTAGCIGKASEGAAKQGGPVSKCGSHFSISSYP